MRSATRAAVVLAGVLLASLIGLGCGTPDSREWHAVALQREGVLATPAPTRVNVEWDFAQELSADGLPLFAFQAFRDLVLEMSGTAPCAGSVTIAAWCRPKPEWAAPVARFTVQRDAPLPSGNLLETAGVADARGVSGAERVRRALVDAAVGGRPPLAPNRVFVLSVGWIPWEDSGQALSIDRVRISFGAARIVTLYGDPD